jgi:hypothetical protein
VSSKQHLGGIAHENLDGLGAHSIKFAQAFFECLAIFANTAYVSDLALIFGIELGAKVKQTL